MEGWNWKHVYAMLADDGKVKIGISKCVHDRVKKIENSKEVKITNYSYTEKCSNPYMVERMIHEELKDFRHFGEWFTVAYEHAVSTMNSIFKKYAKFDEGGNTWEAAEQIFSMFTGDRQENVELTEQLEQVIDIAAGTLARANDLCDKVERLEDENKRLREYSRQLKDTIDMITMMLGGEDSPIIKELVDRAMKTIDEYELPDDLQQMIESTNAQMILKL